ncbi:MAG: DUF4867 family protein [Clostridia bacterium]|nr:DUF4867 family protein [Clostridia bacterium]
MKILSVYDEAFRPYGRVVEGYPLEGILATLEKTPCTDAVVYEPRIEALHQAENAEAVGAALYGGMPFQFGFCNGVNTKLNCLEFHRDSEFNLGTEDFILLVAKQDDIVDGVLDTAKVVAFKAPKGVLVECYATTLHYAPCSAKLGQGFRVLIALPDKTNTDYEGVRQGVNAMDKMLWARNKWLLAHPESSEAAQGAVVALTGVNIDIAADI